MNIQIVILLGIIGTVAAVYVAQMRGYWWPIGLVVGVLLPGIAPLVMLVLPNRKKKRSASPRR